MRRHTAIFTLLPQIAKLNDRENFWSRKFLTAKICDLKLAVGHSHFAHFQNTGKISALGIGNSTPAPVNLVFHSRDLAEKGHALQTVFLGDIFWFSVFFERVFINWGSKRLLPTHQIILIPKLTLQCYRWSSPLLVWHQEYHCFIYLTSLCDNIAELTSVTWQCNVSPVIIIFDNGSTRSESS